MLVYNICIQYSAWIHIYFMTVLMFSFSFFFILLRREECSILPNVM